LADDASPADAFYDEPVVGTEDDHERTRVPESVVARCPLQPIARELGNVALVGDAGVVHLGGEVWKGVLMQLRPLVVGTGILVVAFSLTACDEFGSGVRGSGTVVTESREVSGFNEIVLNGSGDVVVTVDGTESLTIEAEDNIMPLLTTEISNGRLELGAESSISPTEGITYTISAAAMNGVTVSGSGEVTVSGIDEESFEVKISGSGNVEPSGTTGDLAVTVSGSGNYRGEALVAASGEVKVSGSGNALVKVTDVLDVTISGSGNVDYIGDPDVSSSVSGSGNVDQR